MFGDPSKNTNRITRIDQISNLWQFQKLINDGINLIPDCQCYRRRLDVEYTDSVQKSVPTGTVHLYTHIEYSDFLLCSTHIQASIHMWFEWVKVFDTCRDCCCIPQFYKAVQQKADYLPDSDTTAIVESAAMHIGLVYSSHILCI